MNNKLGGGTKYRGNYFVLKQRLKTSAPTFRVFFVFFAMIIIFAAGAKNVPVAKALNNTVQKIDIETYKSIIDRELPLIGIVYNSGTISTSALSSEINDLIKYIFSFDMDDPISILNAQSAILYRYYVAEYKNKENNKLSENDDVKLDNTILQNKNSDGLKEGSSSVSTEGVEKEEPSTGDVNSTGKITVRNETKNKVDIDDLLKDNLKINFDKKRDKILIYHTHTTESFLTDISQLNSEVATRTRDPRYSVVRVGEELAENLRNNCGIQVIHNATVHDYPDYNSSYNNSLKTVTAILKAYSNIKIVIDLHRDAIGDKKKLREVVKVNGKNAAKIMFVVAAGEVKKNHPNWKENLKLALKIQEKLNQQCPGLTLPLNISKYTYNQHVRNGALLIEIGGDGNLLNECLESTKYLSKAIDEVIR